MRGKERDLGVVGGMLVLALALGAVGCASDGVSGGDSGAMSASAVDAKVGDAKVGDAKAGDASGSAAACAWPEVLVPSTSTSRDACHAVRALLSCEQPGGATLSCVSDDRNACADPRVASDSVACTNRCDDDEYVASCGGIGPGPIPEPPEGCHDMAANPGGIVHYCCPCL